MRKALLLAAILLCLCLPVWSEAQSCDGCGIGYRPSSLSSSGGTLTGPLLLPDGSLANPAVAFTSNPDSGLAFFGTPGIGIVLDQISRWTFEATQVYSSATDAAAFGASSRLATHLYVARSTQGSKTKALTAGAATTVATVAVPQTAGANFAAGEVRYTVYATDTTDTQTLNGSAFFSAVNKAGTEACELTDDQIGTEASSSGTLTCTVACAVGLTDVVGITFNCASSLTETTLNALVRFDMQQPNTLTFP